MAWSKARQNKEYLAYLRKYWSFANVDMKDIWDNSCSKLWFTGQLQDATCSFVLVLGFFF